MQEVMSSIHACLNTVLLKQSPDSGYFLVRNAFQDKTHMFLSFYVFLGMLHFCLTSSLLNFIFALTSQLPGCLHSSLAKVSFSRKK